MSQLLRHFGFTHHPFARNAPKGAVFHHGSFDEALERLRFTVELDSIATLIADSGCGKSLLLGQLADELGRAGWLVHYFAYATVGPFGLVNVLCRKVGLSPRRSRAETASCVATALLEDERQHLLVIDEGHELPDATLDDIRLLTIADFDRKSPFVLLLAGQPELDDRLAEPCHHALDQRITTVARLAPLNLEQAGQYIGHRLDAAGAKAKRIFNDDAIKAVFDASAGIPRRINNVATSALIVTAARKRTTVTAQDVHDARQERGRA